MAAPKSKTAVRGGAGRQGRKSSSTPLTFFIDVDHPLRKGSAGFELKVTGAKSKMRESYSKGMKALLQSYEDAIANGSTTRRRVSFHVDVDSEGVMMVRPFAEATPKSASGKTVPIPELRAALAAARAGVLPKSSPAKVC